ncbi:MAG: type II toxin-antitoxin system RatA family toxin [Caulobacterales bacterium]
MSLLEVERRVAHQPTDLFNLVGDVRRYPEFIPWIKAMRVSQIKEEGPKTRFLAEALVGFKMIRERFSTWVARDAEALSIAVDLHSGPFKVLQNRWKFLPDGRGTLVKFAIDFEFSSSLLQMVLSANKDIAAQMIMDAFIREADRRYGHQSAIS